MARTRNDELHKLRRTQVLRAAADGFARKGIHQTTMQEICEASGISAGALYRYFPTKESIVVAFAEAERTEAAKLFSRLDSSPNIVSAFTEIVPELVNGLTDENYGRLTLEVAAEATRKSPGQGCIRSERNGVVGAIVRRSAQGAGRWPCRPGT